MHGIYVAPIVEGHGEVSAIKDLLRRIVSESGKAAYVECNEPIRLSAGSFFKYEAEFRRKLLLAEAKVREAMKTGRYAAGVVLALYDSEDVPPCTKGPEVAAKMLEISSNGGRHHLVALAYREYETWFVAAIESLRGNDEFDGVTTDATAPDNPESMRDAKGYLTARMMNPPYSPTEHQQAFTLRFDFQSARRVHSFARLESRVLSLIPC